MIQLSINLPQKRRLELRMVKRRGNSFEKPLFPALNEIKKARKGNKGSRFFRHVFEHKSIRRVLGINLAFMIIISSLFPQSLFGQEIEAEQTIVSETETPLVTERNIRYPVDEIIISQGYAFLHPGIDLDGIIGDSVYSIKSGIVLATDQSKYAYGNAVLIDHGKGLTSLYAHLSDIKVAKGDEVTPNTVIGELGNTGRAYGDHLHLEIRQNGRPINPFSLLIR